MSVPLTPWRRLVPTSEDYRGLRSRWPRELIAGLTVGIVALPLALGFGVASGAGAAAGLVTAIVAGILAAVFGGSHLQVSGPTGAMTVVLLPVIAQYGLLTVPLLAIMAGVMLVVMAITGLGRVVDLIPWPVVEGFTFGIGVIVAVQQVPLALDTVKGESESTLLSTWQAITHTDWSRAVAPLGIVALVIAVQLIVQRLWPRLPASLLAIIVATAVAFAARLPVATIGQLPSGLPAPALPAMSLSLLMQLAAPALAIAALAALESLLSARVADGLVTDAPRTNADRELLGQGIANIGSGLFGGLPATGAIARTAVNVRSGGRTRVSAITHALVLVVVIVALGPVVAEVPLSALAGVLILTASRMMNFRIAGRIWRTTRADRFTFLATAATTIVLDLIVAVLLGVAMAAIMSLRHMAATSSVRREHLPVHTPTGLVDFPSHELHDTVAVYRIDGALFYADARRFIDTVCSAPDAQGVIIRAHRMHVMDASGAEALREAVRTLARRDIDVVVEGLSPQQLATAVATGAITESQHAVDLPSAIDLMCSHIEVPGRALTRSFTTQVFSYGVFTQDHVHKEVYGRRLSGHLDSLPGYRLTLIDVPDPSVGTLGVDRQPAAVPGNEDDLIAGMRYEIGESELAAIEEVNHPLFEKVWVKLASGEEAWVFVAKEPVSRGTVSR
ncbi:SulP family inorganic anion transporter [Arachnia propionica]|uniref:STAS domain-containing protein n=1 Tax=Arachnia propionica TaxID=1750 RepID=A0A3P1WMG0_9ACTN|nr:SulP family inorganic anion transporter [Arachnia propionica]RRD47365.1 STAS domain-containing protein [Arachnia propionica]